MGLRKSTKRIVAKTITYKIMSVGTSLVVAYLITGSWEVAGGLAVFEAIGKVALYAGHEWLWEKNRGKKNKRRVT